MLVSGDRESEVRYLAESGHQEVYAGQTPEQKLEIVRAETRGRTRCSWATASTTRRR